MISKRKAFAGEISPYSRGFNASNEGLHIRVAQVARVDYENFTVDLLLMDSSASYLKINVTSAYAGCRSFLGGMPSEGDLVLLDFAKAGNFVIPFIVQFLPQGYASGLKNSLIASNQVLVDNGLEKPVRYNMKKLYPGEVYASSTYGSDIHLDKSVLLTNSKLNEISLKSSNQSFNVSALTSNTSLGGIKERRGLVTRNELLKDPTYSDKFPVFYNEDGLPQYLPTYCSRTPEALFGNKTIDDISTEAYIEDRIELKETVTPVLNIDKSNSEYDVTPFYGTKTDGTTERPLVTRVLGTLIGNDAFSKEGIEQYGVILKPRIFKTLDDPQGSIKEEACLNQNGKDETTTLAAAVTLKLPKAGTAVYFNKQGKIFANIAASTSIDPLGAGESAELNFLGHVKASIGKNNKEYRSLNLNTDGGIYTNFGADNIKLRSWDATFRRGVSWNILGADSDNVALNMSIRGDVNEVIEGNRTTVIKGNEKRLIHGVLEDQVFGKKVDNFVNDKSTNYGGGYNETTVGHYSQTIGAGRYTKIFKPNVEQGETFAEKTEVMLGNVEKNLLAGNDIENITVGSKQTSITAGSREVNIKVGEYTVSVTAGNISIKTTLGDISLSAPTGNITITGNMGVTIKSASNVTLMTPKVKLGMLPIQGGVVNDGPAGMKCYITGGPHLGSRTVTCNNV